MDVSVETFLKANPDSYKVDVEGNEVVVFPAPGGKGYCPVNLLAEGKFEEAQKVASAAFRLGL